MGALVALALVTLGLDVAVSPQLAPATAAPTDLLISEYVEGTSNNKAIELFNGTNAAVDLAVGGYALQYFFNGAATAGLTIPLTGTVASGDVHVVVLSTSLNAALLALADQTAGGGWYNGDDAVVLAKAGVAVDSVGQVGVDPGAEWGAGLVSTADNTLRRKPSVTAGDTVVNDPFDPALQWDGFATDTFDGLGAHVVDATDAAPGVVSVTPANGAVDVPLGSSVAVTFSEPVALAAGWFTFSCTISGTVAVTVTGGPTSYTVAPVAPLADTEACTFTVLAAGVTDVDADDPPDRPAADVAVVFTVADVCRLDVTPAYAIQGTGATAAIVGAVSTKGVVVGDYEGPSPTLRGFYLQDATGDADPSTSDAVFVFNGNRNDVQLGDVVHVTGTAAEFQDQTQVTASSVVVCGTGATVAPIDVTLPFAQATDAERYEGMLVRLPQTLSVTEHFQLGRFGQVVVSSGGRLVQPTNVALPGAAANAVQAANNLNRLIIDDALQNQNPDPIAFGRGGQPLSATNTLRGGDTATGTVGVMTYTWAGNAASGNAYRVRPIGALGGHVMFDPTNARPSGAPERAGTLRVASMNLLNFFNTFDGDSSNPPFACTLGVGGALTDCRGAGSAAEFARQWPKTVAAIVATQADVVGVIEVENDGYGTESALAFLVDRLNAATAPGTYAFVDVDAATAQVNALGTDAIKVGLVYKPASVTPVGATAALNTVEFVNGGDAAPRNRPALAQAFQQPDGERFVVAVNHLKSKGSACDAPDVFDGQGNCAIVRTNAAALLAQWLASDPTGTGDPDVLITGDLNSYAREVPITTLEGAGYTNLVRAFGGDTAYSFAFDGQWGYLDHALASPGLVSQVRAVADWHINADEPSVLDYNTNFKSAAQVTSLYAADEFRIADHDPVLVDLDLRYEARPRLVVAAGTYESTTAPGRLRQVALALVASNRPTGGAPAGTLQFLSLGDRISFASSSLTWSTANPARTLARVEGTGRLNGVGGYTFVLWVGDGQPDTVRLQVRSGPLGAQTVVLDTQVRALATGTVRITT